MIAAMDTSIIIVLVVVATLELALVIWALVDLVSRPRTSLLPRWAWAVIVLLLNLIGPLLYLAIGRASPEVVDDRRLPGVSSDDPAIADVTHAGGDDAQTGDQTAGLSRTARAIGAVYGRRPPGE